MDTNALQIIDSTPTGTPASGAGIQDYRPNNFEQAQRFCEVLASSELVPTGYRGKPADVFVAIQYGAEVGLGPMQSLQNISVINGRPAMWGDAPLALVQGSGKLEWIKEWDEGETAYCETKRRGYPTAHRSSFSQEDAKRMGLAGKPGPWQQCTPRMRKLRARGFNLRDQYADVLKGIGIAEEIQDIADLQSPASVVATPEPPAAPSTSKGDAILNKLKSPASASTPAPAAAQSSPEPSAASPVTGGGDSGDMDPWESAAVEAEDFLRNSAIGSARLKGIREAFKLTGDTYPMYPEDREKYLTMLNESIQAMQQRKK